MAKHRRRVVLLAATVLLSSCRKGVLDPHGPVGTAERLMLYDATAIMLAVVVPVILVTLAFAWWFRAGNPYATYADVSGELFEAIATGHPPVSSTPVARH
jgi:heme/copper-type cytochrome/quinol oxidase subunit 2